MRLELSTGADPELRIWLAESLDLDRSGLASVDVCARLATIQETCLADQAQVRVKQSDGTLNSFVLEGGIETTAHAVSLGFGGTVVDRAMMASSQGFRSCQGVHQMGKFTRWRGVPSPFVHLQRRRAGHRCDGGRSAG